MTDSPFVPSVEQRKQAIKNERIQSVIRAKVTRKDREKSGLWVPIDRVLPSDESRSTDNGL